ncbi:MAG TPA: hypothetical protein VJ375_08585, partial [Gaiellaceae bacterium]|nr:hypothetical protein [Gaiellaceae bacterium]
MPLLRRFALLAVVAAGFAAISSPAFAAFVRDQPNGVPVVLPNTLDSPNFRIHYQSDHIVAPAWAITQTQAGDIAALAERALAAIQADGYPRPLSDGALGGDGRIDIYIDDFSSLINAFNTPTGFTKWDTNGPTSSGFIELAGNLQGSGASAFTQHVIAHQLFNLLQLAMWLPAQLSDYWLLTGSAEWMGFRVDGYPAPASAKLGPADMSLDCRDPFGGSLGGPIDTFPPSNLCDLQSDYRGNGDSRWPFFEYLSEKYGAGFVKDIFAQGLAGAPTAIAAVDAALKAKGTDLATAYNAWALDAVTSGWSVSSLQTLRPTPYGPTVFTGASTTDKLFAGSMPTVKVPTLKVTVNHLSTRYLKFERGLEVGGSISTVCWKATLTLTVSIPAGTSSQPVFFWDGSTTVTTPLSINGNTATAAIPWDTCTWDSGEGFLSLPNASNPLSPTGIVDAADFVVSAKLDLSSPLTQVTAVVPTTPPVPVTVTGPVVSAPSSDVAPTITVFGPQLLTLSSTATQIRLIVSASSEGQVKASLGFLTLGTVNLRAGNNDVRFTIPKGTLGTVRRSAVASNVLTLTPTSATGAATGTAVTRTISVTPVKPTVVKKVRAKAPAKKAPAKKTPA